MEPATQGWDDVIQPKLLELLVGTAMEPAGDRRERHNRPDRLGSVPASAATEPADERRDGSQLINYLWPEIQPR